MIVFKVPGNDREYGYPNSLEDIRFDKFLTYSERILPLEPDALKELRTAGTQAQQLWYKASRTVSSYGFEPSLFEEKVEAKKKVDPNYIPAFQEFVDWAKNHQIKPSKKLNKEMDALAEEWRKVHETRTEASAQVADLKILSRVILPYMAKVVSFFTELDYGVILGQKGPAMDYHQLEAIYWTIQRALEWDQTEYKYKESFDFEGQEYVLPGQFMEKGTTIELMEASQFQESMGKLKEGNYYALLDVVSVLLKRVGEIYSDEVYERNRIDFKRLPMSTVMDVVFFLNNRSSALGQSFQIYTLAHQAASLKRVRKPSAMPTAGT